MISPPIVAVLVLLSASAIGGHDYSNAPPCFWDVARNHNILRASAELDAAERASNYSAARNALLNAATNLEQVMNYGALQFSGCMTCNPYAQVNGISYMSVAERLVAVSRWLEQRPDYNEFLGLVETMQNRFQTSPYCAEVANRTNVSSVIGGWEFGRSTSGQVLCGGSIQGSRFELTANAGPRGLQMIGCHPNESFYWLMGQELIFIAADGSISSILRQGSADYWEGPYKLDPAARITHYVSRSNKPQPCASPSWENAQPPPPTLELVEPPYGPSYWSRDGTVYWLLPDYGQYLVVNGNRLERFDKCHKPIVTHQCTKIENWQGVTVWLGVTVETNANFYAKWR